MKEIEFRTASAAQGGLLIMRKVGEIAYGDRVSVRDHRGRLRNGQVIKTSRDVVLVQVFEGTDDLDLDSTWVRFLDQPFQMPVSPDLLGRIFNGVGSPRDGRPPMIASQSHDVNGSSINPFARAYPREFIQTGISTIDGLNALVRGQKLPIFSSSGLPHNRLAAQIVRQARLLGEETNFAIVFAAMGISHDEARFFEEDFESSGVLGNVSMFINLADDPPIERLILPRTALTVAEYLAFDLDRHVLVVMTDMTYYAEALREVATAKGDVPARKGYPGYLYSDLAEIYERSGRIKNRHGSITLMPILSMPADFTPVKSACVRGDRLIGQLADRTSPHVAVTGHQDRRLEHRQRAQAAHATLLVVVEHPVQQLRPAPRRRGMAGDQGVAADQHAVHEI